jgi:hypothetical protein
MSWGSRKTPMQEFLPKIQHVPPEKCIEQIRAILSQPMDPEAPAEQLVQIGVVLMCIQVEPGKIVSAEITNRLLISYALDKHPMEATMAGPAMDVGGLK